MDVLPVFALEPVSKEKEHGEVQQHDEAKPDALVFRGFRHVIEVIDEVSDHRPVFGGRQRARRLRCQRLDDKRFVLARREQDNPFRPQSATAGSVTFTVRVTDASSR